MPLPAVWLDKLASGSMIQIQSVKFVFTQLDITAGLDVVDASLLALVLSFLCKAGIGKGNHSRKIVPVNPISIEREF